MDFVQILQDYKPVEIELLEQKGYNLTENIRSSFLLYNNALVKLSAKSEDIAIIELRKAISLNPEFIDAFNLLGVCYLYIKDNLKAEEMFNKVVAVENNGVRAYKYLNMLKGEELNPVKGKASKGKIMQPNLINPVQSVNPAKPVNPAQPIKSVQSIKPVQLIKGKIVDSKNSLGKFLNGFITGSLIVVLIFVIILFGVNKSYKVKLISERDTVSNTVSSKSLLETQINEYKNKLTKLESEAVQYANEIKTVNTELDYFKNTQKLFEVDKLISAGNFEAACDMLFSLEATTFKGIEKEKYDSLFKDTAPKAAWAVYNQGTTFFNSQNYRDALNKLVKVEQYAPDWQYLSWVMYQIGLSYKELGETDNAITVFQKIKEKFPTSEYAVYSDYRINEIKGR